MNAPLPSTSSQATGRDAFDDACFLIRLTRQLCRHIVRVKDATPVPSLLADSLEVLQNQHSLDASRTRATAAQRHRECRKR